MIQKAYDRTVNVHYFVSTHCMNTIQYTQKNHGLVTCLFVTSFISAYPPHGKNCCHVNSKKQINLQNGSQTIRTL